MNTSLETMSLTEECALNEFVFKSGGHQTLYSNSGGRIESPIS